MPSPKEGTGKFHSHGKTFSSMEELLDDYRRGIKALPLRKKIPHYIGRSYHRQVNRWLRPTPYRKAVWFVQRGRRGWAECDTWSVDSYVAKVLAEMLPVLAARDIAWPGDGTGGKWKTPEEWTDHLNDLADRIGAWSMKRGTGFEWDKFEVSHEAMKEFADNFGFYWD